VFGSADAAEKEVRSDERLVSGLPDRVVFALVAEGELFVENGEKTVPNTRFAFSREASFLNSTLNREGVFGGGGGGGGRRSRGTNPAGNRVICIECGRRCLGRQGGVGSLLA
jgi:hypothetical protein